MPHAYNEDQQAQRTLTHALSILTLALSKWERDWRVVSRAIGAAAGRHHLCFALIVEHA